jgi:hypothetical protein
MGDLLFITSDEIEMSCKLKLNFKPSFLLIGVGDLFSDIFFWFFFSIYGAS